MTEPCLTLSSDVSYPSTLNCQGFLFMDYDTQTHHFSFWKVRIWTLSVSTSVMLLRILQVVFMLTCLLRFAHEFPIRFRAFSTKFQNRLLSQPVFQKIRKFFQEICCRSPQPFTFNKKYAIISMSGGNANPQTNRHPFLLFILATRKKCQSSKTFFSFYYICSLSWARGCQLWLIFCPRTPCLLTFSIKCLIIYSKITRYSSPNMKL